MWSKYRESTVDNSITVTYRAIFNLKFKKGVSTSELIQRFPKEAAKVREIALLQIPTPLLKKVVPEEHLLEKVLLLKRKFSDRTD